MRKWGEGRVVGSGGVGKTCEVRFHMFMPQNCLDCKTSWHTQWICFQELCSWISIPDRNLMCIGTSKSSATRTIGTKSRQQTGDQPLGDTLVHNTREQRATHDGWMLTVNRIRNVPLECMEPIYQFL